MRLIVVRHGETEENARQIVQGHMPGKLSRKGIRQAKAIGLRLRKAKIDVIFSSDLRRTRDTASEIARFHRIPVHYARELRERHSGIFQGKHSSVFTDAVMSSGMLPAAYRPEGGESVIDLRGRVRKFVRILYKDYGDKTVLIVTHGGVARALLYVYSRAHHRKVEGVKTVNTGILVIDVKGRSGKIIKDAMFLRKGHGITS